MRNASTHDHQNPAHRVELNACWVVLNGERQDGSDRDQETPAPIPIMCTSLQPHRLAGDTRSIRGYYPEMARTIEMFLSGSPG